MMREMRALVVNQDEGIQTSPYSDMRTVVINGETIRAPHRAYDIARQNRNDQVLIHAPHNGTITYVDDGDAGYAFGYHAEIRFTIQNVEYLIILGHLQRPNANNQENYLQNDQQVNASDVIGVMGNTGAHTGGANEGVHVHFEMRRGAIGQLQAFDYRSNDPTISIQFYVDNWY
jgi:murein DD-endopeptidase MepM/ murein hydrolase activator NlpD